MTSQRSFFRTRFRRAADQLPYLPQALGFIWTAAPRWTVAWAGVLLVLGVLPAATVALSGRLVQELSLTMGSGTRADMQPVLLLVFGLLLVTLLANVFTSAMGIIRTAQAGLVQDHIAGLVYARSTDVDFAFYDSPAYFDRLYRARTDAGHRPMALLENTGGLVQGAITFVAMAFILLPFGWWLPVALALSTLPALFVVLHQRLRLHSWRMATTQDQRRAWYLDWLLTARENAAEVRLLDLAGHFRAAFGVLRARLRTEELALAKTQNTAELGAGALGLVVTAVIMVWFVWQAVQGLLTPGQLTVIFLAFTQGQRLMGTLLGNVGDIYTNSLFLADLFQFLDMAPHVVDPPAPQPAPQTLTDGIRFAGVTFRYPASSRLALDALDLFVPAGRITAIVGSNGAGKSTLVKLLCRLYDPDAGSITLDGIDLRALRIPDLRRLITVLFQEPVQYNATVAENIALGDLSGGAERADIEAAAQAAGASTPVSRLPDGYDTLLGTWFDGGTDLSVGEWQRIALARAFLRQAPVLVLDEPTSAMDSWAEADWLARFRTLAAGRTVIIITHRFTTAMQADVIHVMESGHIVESGDHASLVASGGRYARSWQAQLAPPRPAAPTAA
jgi:ATP-binding cassette subfamily B protein